MFNIFCIMVLKGGIKNEHESAEVADAMTDNGHC